MIQKGQKMIKWQNHLISGKQFQKGLMAILTGKAVKGHFARLRAHARGSGPKDRKVPNRNGKRKEERISLNFKEIEKDLKISDFKPGGT